MANGIVNDIANDIVNAINNFIAGCKADSPVHARVNRIVKVHPLHSQWQSQQYRLFLW
jgi:hypothetical protein